MKKTILIFISIVAIVLIKPVSPAHAQGMMGRFWTDQVAPTASESSTSKDEAAGKVVYDKLQSKQTTCKDLTDDDFDVLGDYFMGLRLGNTTTHESMNNMMTNMMGEEGEKQMHIALGKRLSGCDINAPVPNQGSNFLPMMGIGGMMNGGGMGNYWYGNGRSMMGYNSPYTFFSPLISVLVIVFLVLGIIYFWKEIKRKK